MKFEIKKLPRLPFVTCPGCGRRLPVRCDPHDFFKRCPVCGRYVEEDAFEVHCLGCTGKHIKYM